MLQLLSRVQSVQAMIFQRQRSSLGDMPVDWQSGSKVHLASHQRQNVVAVVIMLRRGIAVSRVSRKMPACSIVTCAGLFSILKFVHEKAMLARPPCLHPNVCVSRQQFPCEFCATCTKIGPKIARAHGTVVGLRECPETLGSSHSRPDSPNHGIGDVP